MGIDIRIRADKQHGPSEEALSFGDDGYYWFLHPLFERLRDECGKYVDLYGDALFTRDDYPRLRGLLEEAEGLARRQPRAWEVHVGTQLQPTRKEIYRTVERDKLLGLLGKFRSMVDKADKLGAVLECLGD